MIAKSIGASIFVNNLSENNIDKYLSEAINLYNSNCDGILLEFNGDVKANIKKLHLLLNLISKNVFLPISFLGKFNTSDEIGQILSIGIDKIILNYASLKQKPYILNQAYYLYGKHSILAFLNVKSNDICADMDSIERLGVGGVVLSGDLEYIKNNFDLQNRLSKLNIPAFISLEKSFDKNSLLSLESFFKGYILSDSQKDSSSRIYDLKAFLNKNKITVRL